MLGINMYLIFSLLKVDIGSYIIRYAKFRAIKIRKLIKLRVTLIEFKKSGKSLVVLKRL